MPNNFYAQSDLIVELLNSGKALAKFQEIDPQYPEITDAHRQELQQARLMLEAEDA